MVKFEDPSNVPLPDISPPRAICRAFANLVAVAELPTSEAVMAPASKLPSASLFTSVFAVFDSVSIGLSYLREFQAVTPSPTFSREVSISIPNSP